MLAALWLAGIFGCSCAPAGDGGGVFGGWSGSASPKDSGGVSVCGWGEVAVEVRGETRLSERMAPGDEVLLRTWLDGPYPGGSTSTGYDYDYDSDGYYYDYYDTYGGYRYDTGTAGGTTTAPPGYDSYSVVILVAGHVAGTLPNVNVTASVTRTDSGEMLGMANGAVTLISEGGSCEGSFQALVVELPGYLDLDAYCALEGAPLEVTLVVTDPHTGASGGSAVVGAAELGVLGGYCGGR